MTKLIRLAVLLGVVAMLLSGCMRYTPPIESDRPLDPAKGYLYGRFSIDPAFSGALQIGLIVSSVDEGEEVALRFEKDGQPYAVDVKPGEYKATKVIFTKQNQIQGEKPIPAELAGRIISVEAGKAYYLGDYEGESKSTFMVLFIADQWRLKKASNEFAKTTAQLETLLPNFKNVPKTDVFGDAIIKLLPSH